MHLLIVESDILLNSILSNMLCEAGYRVDSCFNLLDGISFTKAKQYDCIIADTKLPINSNLLLQSLNAKFHSSAILLLTAPGEQEFPYNDNQSCFIEYLAKPFTFEKLLIRIELLILKNQTHNRTLLLASNIVMNTLNHTVIRDETHILLTDKEFTLLEYLLIHKGETLSREQISEAVWNLNVADC